MNISLQIDIQYSLLLLFCDKEENLFICGITLFSCFFLYFKLFDATYYQMAKTKLVKEKADDGNNEKVFGVGHHLNTSSFVNSAIENLIVLPHFVITRYS